MHKISNIVFLGKNIVFNTTEIEPDEVWSVIQDGYEISYGAERYTCIKAICDGFLEWCEKTKVEPELVDLKGYMANFEDNYVSVYIDHTVISVEDKLLVKVCNEKNVSAGDKQAVSEAIAICVAKVFAKQQSAVIF